MKNKEFGCDYSMSFHKVDVNDKNLLKKFKCEYPAISEFIRNDSIESKSDVSYVFVDNDENRIMGFCAVCCTGIMITKIDDKGNPYNTSIPSVLIDYFAVDEDYRGLKFDEDSTRYETLSKAFFLYILDVIREISIQNIGATHICLYSVPKAKSFYKRCGFSEFDTYMNSDEVPFLEGCVPMFYTIDK